MVDAQVLSRFLGVLADLFDLGPEEVPLSLRWADSGLESLDLAELLLAVEEEFGIVIEDDDLAEIVTVGDAVRWLAAAAQEGE